MTTQKEKVTITGNHVEITPALSQLVHKKFDRLLKNFGRFTSSFDIILKVETQKNQIAEVNAHVLNGTILNATATTPDLYKSIDEIAQKMQIQLEKYKGKHFNHHEEISLKVEESVIANEMSEKGKPSLNKKLLTKVKKLLSRTKD